MHTAEILLRYIQKCVYIHTYIHTLHTYTTCIHARHTAIVEVYNRVCTIPGTYILQFLQLNSIVGDVSEKNLMFLYRN